MFHRVKSESSVKEKEAPVETIDELEAEAQQQAQAAAQAAQRAQNATTQSSQQTELAIEDVAVTDAVEDVAEAEDAQASPAQSLYQRTTARPASFSPRASAYASPAAPSVKRSSAPASEAAENDRRLTIGRGITMSGEIECCDELQVEGTVEAALKGAKFLNITDTGVFYGTVEIEDAVIAGRFEGEIIVNGRLTLEETGVITGSVSYKELEIKSGAVLDGRVTPLNTSAKSA